MKKIFYFLLLSISFTNAQINFEHTYVNQGDKMTNYNSFDFDVIYTESGMKYVTYNRTNTSSTSTSTEVKIYNEDHSLLKTVICPNLIRVYAITDKLFNNNNKIEILYQAARFTTYSNLSIYLSDVVLRDEDGLVLFNAEERIGAKIYKTSNGSYKLIVHTYDRALGFGGFNFDNENLFLMRVTSESGAQYNSTYFNANASSGSGYVNIPYSYDVYGLSGTLSNEQEHQYLKNSMIGYPIPTRDRLSISNKLPLEQDSKLEVYDMNGKKIFEKEVTAGTKDLNIDVSSFTSGTYIYKLNGVSSKFIKE